MQFSTAKCGLLRITNVRGTVLDIRTIVRARMEGNLIKSELCCIGLGFAMGRRRTNAYNTENYFNPRILIVVGRAFSNYATSPEKSLRFLKEFVRFFSISKNRVCLSFRVKYYDSRC